MIGVLLTGADDDGTAGLKAIKDRGGVAMVQDPLDSAHPKMPRLSLAEIGPRLAKLVRQAAFRRASVSEPIDRSFGQEEGLRVDVGLLGTPSAVLLPGLQRNVVGSGTAPCCASG